MRTGFVPALGTPLDKDGNFLVASFTKQVEQQLAAGAVGVLCMGSMGQQAFLRSSVCRQAAETAVAAVKGRVPVFVGAMDNSIARVRERLAALEDLDVAGFVFTTPYYHPCGRDQMMNFFRAVAASTEKKIILYDLAVVTQSKITYDMVVELAATVPNMGGIKSADLQMMRRLKLNPDIPKDFVLVYSGLDTFDVAYRWGIPNCLDGMFDATPVNAGKMFTAMDRGDYDTAAVCLNNIVALRDFFAAHDLWPSFSKAMNLLGCEGNFSPDYISPFQKEFLPALRTEMERIGEL